MAEAAALALGAQLLKALRVHKPFFLSDSQQLVNFFNGADHSNPPHWDIKPLTQTFCNINSEIGGRIFKVDRKLNTTAHILAHQAYHSDSNITDAFKPHVPTLIMHLASDGARILA
jgi:hypothetical protein